LTLLLTVAMYLPLVSVPVTAQDTITVGSKNFNESYLLGEIIAQRLELAGFEVERRFGLGGTLVCYEALRKGEIDLYVEYNGTQSRVILKTPELTEATEINTALADQGLQLSGTLGFNNTYAMVMKQELAAARNIRSISDLADHEDLRLVFDHEFLEREDGWPGLSRSYGLGHRVSGIQHGLAYQALDEGAIQVSDAYSTDGEIPRYGLTVLTDDRGFFPAYLAAPLFRSEHAEKLLPLLAELTNSLDDGRMQALNAAVTLEQRSFADVAAQFLGESGLASGSHGLPWAELRRNTVTHLRLTGIALGLAIVVGLGGALLVYQSATLSRSIVYFCGLMQTIPSIALLALLIPFLGIGELPAILALFLYSLLPIVRNTVTALTSIDPVLRRIAVAMGLSTAQRLRHVFIPLSLPSILAGVRTAAVVSIGTATLAAFIGAGGLGDPIVTGLALNDSRLILQGAIPAALLAVVTELLFEAIERKLLPAHMRSAN
jgi:osmoprotectant transport system permease protein